MIKVSGAPFEISSLMRDYPAGSLERGLLYAMSEGKDEHKYNSVDALKFDLHLRGEVVKAAIGLYDSDFSFAVFSKSRCNHAYWNRTENGGFLLKDGASPSNAIRDIYTNGSKYATECATAIIIVYSKALLEVFGETLFNQQFPKIYLKDWSSEPIISDLVVERNITDHLYGDGSYFANPDHDPKAPEWQGENVIVLPNGLFYGHGIGIQTADKIIHELNRKRKEGSTHPAYLNSTVNHLDPNKLYDIYTRPVKKSPLIWKPFPPARRVRS